MILFFLFINFINFVQSLRVCVVGASSSLGREIIYQGLNDYNYNMIGVTKTSEKVCVPYRGTGLNDKSDKTPIEHKNLGLYTYLDKLPDYNSIVFCTGGTAFEKLDFYDYLSLGLTAHELYFLRFSLLSQESGVRRGRVRGHEHYSTTST